MRYRLMASYDGSPFEAGIGPTADDIVLFAACPPPEELGFEPATGHWRKRVRFAEIQAMWESRPVGVFRGERCLVLDDLGDRLHIGYLGHDAVKAEHLGYWQVDRGVFELIAPRTEVTDILEERVDVSRPAAAEHTWGPEHPSGPIEFRGPLPVPATDLAPAYVPVPDGRTGVSLPAPPADPLPLEAAAMRAASASRLRDDTATGRAPRRRMDTEQLFADLASLAGIPAHSYAIDAEVDGAMCLVEAEDGFEVFRAAGGARHELQAFATEEAACFYLFGVLAAEAVRTGGLGRMERSAGLRELRTRR